MLKVESTGRNVMGAEVVASAVAQVDTNLFDVLKIICRDPFWCTCASPGHRTRKLDLAMDMFTQVVLAHPSAARMD